MINMQSKVINMPDLKIQSSFPRFLKFWRALHNLNQEELAFRLNSSPRHISRLENGSSRPSEAIIKEITQALNMGDRDRNRLLMSAGYAPDFKKINFHAPELKWLRKAMTLHLKALDPHPTALLDSSMNILMVNKAWVGFYSDRTPKDIVDNVTNFYDFFFSHQQLDNSDSSWKDTLSVILMSLQQQALISNDPDDCALQKRLALHPSVPADWKQRAAKLEPMASFRTQAYIKGSRETFFCVNSTVAALGPTAFESEPQLTINTMFPEDEELDLSIFIKGDIKHPLLCY